MFSLQTGAWTIPDWASKWWLENAKDDQEKIAVACYRTAWAFATMHTQEALLAAASLPEDPHRWPLEMDTNHFPFVGEQSMGDPRSWSVAAVRAVLTHVRAGGSWPVAKPNASYWKTFSWPKDSAEFLAENARRRAMIARLWVNGWDRHGHKGPWNDKARELFAQGSYALLATKRAIPGDWAKAAQEVFSAGCQDPMLALLAGIESQRRGDRKESQRYLKLAISWIGANPQWH